MCVNVCVYVCAWCLHMCVVHRCVWHRLSDSALPSWPHSRAQQPVNGGRKQQSCHRGAGGAPDTGSCHSHTRTPTPTPLHTHPESEPHPVSPSDTHRPVADSSHSGSHKKSQSHTLQRSLAHTAAETRLPAHTQSLSHDQGRERSAGLGRQALQAT